MQSLERGSSGMDLSTKFGKEIPSRNLREKRSEINLRGLALKEVGGRSSCFVVFFVYFSLAIAIPMHRSLHTPEPRNPPKSLKRVFRPECQKSVEQARTLILTLFWVFWDFFDTFFLTLRARRPGKTPFETFWGFRDSGVWRLLYT